MNRFHLQSGPRTFTGGQPSGPGHGSLLVSFRVGFLSSQHGLFLGKWKRDSEAAGKMLSCCQAHGSGEKAHTGAAAREQPQDSPVIAR